MTGTAEAIVVENWARRVREAMLVKSPGRLCLWVIPMKPLDVLRWISAVDNFRIRRISSLRVSVFCVYMPHRELLSPSRKAPRSLEWNDFLAPSGLHFETNRVDSVAATIKLFGFINFLYEATVHSTRSRRCLGRYSLPFCHSSRDTMLLNQDTFTSTQARSKHGQTLKEHYA